MCKKRGETRPHAARQTLARRHLADATERVRFETIPFAEMSRFGEGRMFVRESVVVFGFRSPPSFSSRAPR